MFCVECGCELGQKANFCPNCGQGMSVCREAVLARLESNEPVAAVADLSVESTRSVEEVTDSPRSSDRPLLVLLATTLAFIPVDLFLQTTSLYDETSFTDRATVLSNLAYLLTSVGIILYDRDRLTAVGLKPPSLGWLGITPVYLWKRGKMAGNQRWFWGWATAIVTYLAAVVLLTPLVGVRSDLEGYRLATLEALQADYDGVTLSCPEAAVVKREATVICQGKQEGYGDFSVRIEFTDADGNFTWEIL